MVLSLYSFPFGKGGGLDVLRNRQKSKGSQQVLTFLFTKVVLLIISGICILAYASKRHKLRQTRLRAGIHTGDIMAANLDIHGRRGVTGNGKATRCGLPM